MNTLNPKVSVIIPTYNRPQYLERAINSVFGQTYTNLEVIIVDDNDPLSIERKETENEVARLKKKYPSLIHIKHSHNKGGSAARNTGVDNATGECIAFLDDDDEWLPLKIEKQLEALRDFDAVCVASKIEGSSSKRGHIKKFKYGEVFLKDLRRANRIGSTSTLLVKRSVFEFVRFDEGLRNSQDWDFYICLLKNHHRLMFLDAALLFFYADDNRQRISTFAQNKSVKDLLALKSIYDKHGDIFSKWGVKCGKTRFLLSYIGTRKNRNRFIGQVIQEMGLFPVLAVLFLKTIRVRT